MPELAATAVEHDGHGARLRHGKRLLVAIWLMYVGLALLGIRFHDLPIREPDDAYYYVQTAKNIVGGKGHITGFLFAYQPPLFPAFIAASLSLGLSSIAGLKLVSLLVLSTSVFLVYWICKRLTSQLAGLAGAALFGVMPWMISLPNMLLSECLFLPLYLLCLALLIAAFQNRSIGALALAGATSGIASLCREILLYLPVVLFVLLLLWRQTRKRAVLYGLVFSIAHFAVILPWTVRNYALFGHVVPISTNPWINIYIGNNPVHENVDSWTWLIPQDTIWNAREQPDGRDEYEAMKRSKQEAVAYIAREPMKFVERFLKRALRFVTPHFGLVGKLGTSRAIAIVVCWSLVLYSALLAGFVGAAWREWRSGGGGARTGFLVFAILLSAYLAAVAGITTSNERYRLPMTILMLIVSTQWAPIGWARLARNRRGTAFRAESDEVGYHSSVGFKA
jgi:4-amino-4-deoxy-L-arabinose transferase-like glycosyltransferase